VSLNDVFHYIHYTFSAVLVILYSY